VLNPIQAFFRREVDRGKLGINPARSIDVPEPDSKRAKRIASSAEAAKLLEALPQDDRALWACAFYAGLRRGELQALRVRDVELGASVIRVERGWDQEEGAIDPKSNSSRRPVPLLAVLRDYLDERLIRTGRSGDDLVFGRTAADPFSPPVIGVRAKAAWEAAELDPITLHECRHTFASLLIGREPEGDSGVHGALEDSDHVRYLRALDRGKPRRGSAAHGRLSRQRDRGGGSCSVSAALAHSLAHRAVFGPSRNVGNAETALASQKNAPLGSGAFSALQGGEICMCVVCVREVGRIRRREGR
jgi:integrase